MGKIAKLYWNEIPRQFPYMKLGDFVIMPNHVHGILIIDKTNDVSPVLPVSPVETRLIASLPTPPTQSTQPSPPSSPPQSQSGGFSGNKNPMNNENISRIIRWYKGRCSFEIRKTNTDFAWQPRFHDHIIRNDAEYQRISDYIINNPANW
ncbi:transposase [Bacteroidales bacterium OttesenSCG-928-K03]|nr:transposase [Bacteroidales bacterium OttesenSCG-928-K03]